MTQNADTVEALLIVEADEHDGVENIYVMPFFPMVEGIEYTSVGVDREMQKNALLKSHACHL